MTFKEKPKLPTDKRFDASLGMRYAEELRQRQEAGAFGAFNRGSHNLQANELLLSNMVMQGLNNLAYITTQMKRDPLAVAPVPVPSTSPPPP
jgi:hypothetical protein